MNAYCANLENAANPRMVVPIPTSAAASIGQNCAVFELSTVIGANGPSTACGPTPSGSRWISRGSTWTFRLARPRSSSGRNSSSALAPVRGWAMWMILFDTTDRCRALSKHRARPE